MYDKKDVDMRYYKTPTWGGNPIFKGDVGRSSFSLLDPPD